VGTTEPCSVITGIDLLRVRLLDMTGLSEYETEYTDFSDMPAENQR
jgi:hypothetical protein